MFQLPCDGWYILRTSHPISSLHLGEAGPRGRGDPEVTSNVLALLMHPDLSVPAAPQLSNLWAPPPGRRDILTLQEKPAGCRGWGAGGLPLAPRVVLTEGSRVGSCLERSALLCRVEGIVARTVSYVEPQYMPQSAS